MAELTDEEVADTEGDGYIGSQRDHRLVEELGTHISRASAARQRKGSTLCLGAGHQWCHRHEVEALPQRDLHADARGFGVCHCRDSMSSGRQRRPVNLRRLSVSAAQRSWR